MSDWANDEQRDYMESLGRMTPADLCWCGWYELGRCPHCPHGKTAADKLAVWCPTCRCAPPADGSGGIRHAKWCTAQLPSEEGA